MRMNELRVMGELLCSFGTFPVSAERQKLGFFYPIGFKVMLLNRSFDAVAYRAKLSMFCWRMYDITLFCEIS
jgi:hypothetical protein